MSWAMVACFQTESMRDNHHPDACLSVVVRAHTEPPTRREVLDKVLALPQLLEVIIVDDGSTDGSAEVARAIAQEHDCVRFERITKNSGKTAALRTGFALTRGSVVIVQDADLEYDPTEIPNVIQPIVDGHADVVYGSRFLVRKAARVLYFYHFLANKLLTFISNTLTNLNMTDIETGYTAFRGEIIRNMIIRSTGFGFEVEATAKVAKLNVAIYEVPISYYGRTYSEGKKIVFLDGLLALWLVFRFNLFCSLRASYREVPELDQRPRLLQSGALRSDGER